MTKKKTLRFTINLSSRGKETIGKVVYGWTINAGRAIIVGIELIALAALGYRFVIDRQIVDTHDKIRIQESFIAAQAADEKIYKSIHDRLESIKSTDEETSIKIEIMNEILRAISSGIFFSTNLSINNKSILMDGSTFSVITLTEFLNKLKILPSVAAISIDEITAADDGIRFKARIDIKDMSKAKP